MIQKSPIHHSQLTKDEVTIQFADVLKMTTHKTVDHDHETSEMNSLSKSILDSLFVADTKPEEKPFDDSERRQQAKLNVKHRDLKVLRIFISITTRQTLCFWTRGSRRVWTRSME